MGLNLNFGQSWFGVIFNPVGYTAQRKSPENAANDYINNNPPQPVFGGEREFAEARTRWVEGCASKLKSDDVGKSKANCIAACQGVYDLNPAVAQMQAEANEAALVEEEEIKAQNADLTKKIIAIVILIILIIALIIILK